VAGLASSPGGELASPSVSDRADLIQSAQTGPAGASMARAGPFFHVFRAARLSVRVCLALGGRPRMYWPVAGAIFTQQVPNENV